MTPPAAIDGAEFRSAALRAEHLRHVEHMRELVVPLLHKGATLADELERVKTDAARLKHLHDDPKRAQAYFWNYDGRKERNAAIDADIVTAKLKDRT